MNDVLITVCKCSQQRIEPHMCHMNVWNFWDVIIMIVSKVSVNACIHKALIIIREECKLICFELQQEDDHLQQKPEVKSHRQSSAKKAASQSEASHTHRPTIHDKRWTDGSVSWDTLPSGLVYLGKVLLHSNPLLYNVCHLLKANHIFYYGIYGRIYWRQEI